MSFSVRIPDALGAPHFSRRYHKRRPSHARASTSSDSSRSVTSGSSIPYNPMVKDGSERVSCVCIYAILLLLLLSDFRSGAVDEFTRHGHTMFLFRTESTTPIVFFFPRVLHYYAADDENERRLFPIRPPTLTEIPVTLLNKSFIRSKKKCVRIIKPI